MTDELGANGSMRLSAGDWECVIDMASESSSPKQFSSYVRVMLLISGIMILTAALAYWKLRAAGRRADEIPYEQLQMGVANADSIRGRTVETAEEGRDQSWGDDDWDEVKAVKSPSSVHNGNLLENGIKDD